ncbi:outer membrane beta-barrel protein [Vibrio paucivorans]|uniref:Outer membrane protein beta-barrel domain-containing protein n=1 Tax=Vibrio paucivorans TaxID=2829489 RepID=A0A9X3HRJ9_9VIBR|nr:outer membrane beta-barrel protein [Vibrio paucivorans]MCW8334033.1 hypothetical protein [Vibrio paucivorans]
MKLKYAVLGLAVVMGFASAAQASQTDYFWGIDAGYTLPDTGNMKFKNVVIDDGVSMDESGQYSTSGGLALGLYGGVVLNEHHKLSFGYRADSSIQNLEASEEEDNTLSTIHEFYTRYDYLVPITNALDWTVGGTLGYEQAKVGEVLKPKGFLYGAQTGLEYRFTHWLIGTDVAYVKHGMEDGIKNEFGEVNVSFDDELQLMTHIEYRY